MSGRTEVWGSTVFSILHCTPCSALEITGQREEQMYKRWSQRMISAARIADLVFRTHRKSMTTSTWGTYVRGSCISWGLRSEYSWSSEEKRIPPYKVTQIPERAGCMSLWPILSRSLNSHCMWDLSLLGIYLLWSNK